MKAHLQQPIHTRLLRIHEKFLIALSDRRNEMEATCILIEQQTASTTDLQSLQDHGHALAGTGLTFGFGKISETGLALEHYLKYRENDTGTLLLLTKGLIDSCNDALR